MFDSGDLQLLALNTPSGLAQRVIKNSPDLQYYLCFNQRLAPDIWIELFQELGFDRKIEEGAQHAADLLRCAPTLELQRLILTAPQDVISQYLRCARFQVNPDFPEEELLNPVPKEIVTALLDPIRYPSEELAAALIISGEIAPEQIAPLWKRVVTGLDNPEQRLVALDDESYFETAIDALLVLPERYPTLSDTEIVTMLEPLAHGIHEVCRNLIDLRPSVISAMLASPKAHYFSGAIAGSRHLREPLGSQLFELAAAGYKDSKTADIYNQGTLIYLAGNYAMPHELRLKAYELLSTFSDKDSEGYSALVAEERQAVADELQPLTTPWEELAGAEFDALLALQGEKGFWDYPSLLGIYRFNQQDNLPEDEPFSAQYVVSELSPRLDKLGLTVWELFIAMLEGWSGSIDELIEVATSTSKK